MINDKNKEWKVLSSKHVFKDKWYSLRKDVIALPDGKIIDDYYVSERPDVVTVFPVTHDGEVIMVEQYKHGIRQVLKEFPGGVIDEGEDIVSAAERELLEETGYKAEKLVRLSSLIDNPTKDTNRIHLFIALGAEKVQDQDLDETEDINVLKVPLENIKRDIENGEICVAGAVSLAFLSLNYLQSKQFSI